MDWASYAQHDAVGLGELVARREVHPRELLDAARDAADRLNPELNAVVARLDDRAERAADVVDPGASPLAGVPYLLKDLGVGIEGVPTSHGCGLFRDTPMPETSTAVARSKAAGLVIFGKTNTPEFGLSLSTEPRAFGPTRNPHDLRRSAGGSSGGSAAAVASGIVPAAHASDGGGSIRCPASVCGLFGLKPTRARVPMGPTAAEAWNGMATMHAITRSVRDSAALLDVAAGPEPGDPYAAPPPDRPYLDEVGRDPGTLRIALTRDGDVPSDGACRAAVERVARMCEDLVHRVEETAPAFDHDALRTALLTLVTVHSAAQLDQIAELLGRELQPGELEAFTEALAAQGRPVPGTEMVRMRDTILGLGRRFGRFFQGFDIWLTPTLAQPPAKLGWLDPDGVDAETLLTRHTLYGPFLPLANATGCPAANLPLVWSEDGLPLGVMAMAPFGREDRLLRLAAQLEAAHPDAWGITTAQ
ncbi:amidase [Limimonas halophila]|uniref:Amidase n=1 Tax=Limimonas halophila TaxID=1082479 RepID=A0A1G7M2B4_9PROT|nr:amidase [Limimonas halophila]SDF55319.1 amidase [Limimonas halophila]